MLLLDEPTDNLDLASAEALEQALAAFEGTVLVVTHDRWFTRGFDRFVLFAGDVRPGRRRSRCGSRRTGRRWGLRRDRGPPVEEVLRQAPAPVRRPPRSHERCEECDHRFGALSEERADVLHCVGRTVRVDEHPEDEQRDHEESDDSLHVHPIRGPQG
ncbi:hypothetical protein GCM10023320_52720 [Pseudonocardia adelaidensis]|uniref:ABC transporter family protein n=1 Tax=Pseudonocardia adelaidensis TaxID=648754 RepID=A0ABP9NQ35_9PSEU